jgi:hypothetical protein
VSPAALARAGVSGVVASDKKDDAGGSGFFEPNNLTFLSGSAAGFHFNLK